MARDEGVDFVKTSTGFGPEIGVKAAGGIADLDAALAVIRAGATRIGASRSVQIVEEAS